MVNRWLPALAVLLAAHIAFIAVPRAEESTAPPGEIPSAEPASGYIVVTAPEADVLAIPATSAKVLLKSVKGDLFPLKGQLAGWYFVDIGEASTGWMSRGSAALLLYPEFLDPVRLRESYTPPPFVPHVPWGYWDYPGYFGYPGYTGYPGWWDHGVIPYRWRDPLGWGLWLHEGNRHGGHGGDQYRNRPEDHRPAAPAPPPPRGPGLR